METQVDVGKKGDSAGWVSERIFHRADDFFEGLLAEIQRAEKSIDLEMYIYDDDDLGCRVAAALADAARRGVAVRVLIDAFGSPDWPGKAAAILASAGSSSPGIEWRIYHPKPWSFPGLKGLWSRPGFFMQVIRNMNRRDHRKAFIIDGRVAWLGSMNVSVRSLRAVRGVSAWHECGVRIEGGEVFVLTHAFEYAWDRVTDPLARFSDRKLQARRVAAFRGAHLVRVNAPYKLRRRHRHELLQRIKSARRRVWIETPYFIPTPRLVTALCLAARSGADVRLILPRRSDIFFIPWIVPAFLAELAGRGLQLFEYLPSNLHAKIMMIDDWVTVGSSNLNHRSLFHDLEIDAVMTSRAAHADLEERLLADMRQSVEVTSETLKMRPFMLKVLGRMMMPLRYWM